MPAGTSPGSKGPIRSPDRAALSNLMLCPKAISSEGSPFNLSRAATLLSTTLGIVPVSMSRFRPRSPAIDPFATIRCCSTRSNGTSAGSRSPCRVTNEQNERAAAIAAPASLWRMAPPRLRAVRSEGRARAQRKSCGDAEVRVEFRRNHTEGLGNERADARGELFHAVIVGCVSTAFGQSVKFESAVLSGLRIGPSSQGTSCGHRGPLVPAVLADRRYDRTRRPRAGELSHRLRDTDLVVWTGGPGIGGGPLKIVWPFLTVRLSIAGHPIQLLVDTGSRDLVLFKSRMPAALLPLPWKGEKIVEHASGAATCCATSCDRPRSVTIIGTP